MKFFQLVALIFAAIFTVSCQIKLEIDGGKISAAEETERIISVTYLPEYSAKNITLRKALSILDNESEKYGKIIGYEPIKFQVDDYVADKKVTFITKHVSMKTVCEVLSEQTAVPIKYGDKSVRFYIDGPD